MNYELFIYELFGLHIKLVWYTIAPNMYFCFTKEVKFVDRPIERMQGYFNKVNSRNVIDQEDLGLKCDFHQISQIESSLNLRVTTCSGDSIHKFTMHTYKEKSFLFMLKYWNDTISPTPIPLISLFGQGINTCILTIILQVV